MRNPVDAILRLFADILYPSLHPVLYTTEGGRMMDRLWEETLAELQISHHIARDG